MKASRISGVIALLLALCALGLGIYGGLSRSSPAVAAATEAQRAVAARKRAAERTAPSAQRKVESALSGAQKAGAAAEEALAALTALEEKRAAGQSGDEVIDALRAAGADEMADRLWMAEYLNAYGEAHDAAASAREQLLSAWEAVTAVYAEAGLTAPETPAPPAEVPETPADFASCLAAARELTALSQALEEGAAQAAAAARAAGEAASAASAADPAGKPLRLRLSDGYIGLLFTGAILLCAALTLLFAAARFAALWKKYPLFSTLIALLALMVVQVYALGFAYDSVGQWAGAWLSNMLNVLRSNSSVGMIALGMTLVIITGGIDLAVGSTLAGVATVVMVLLDVSARGVLTNAGVTGLPNYLIAIAAGLLSGAAVGALIGLGVTKGKIPPFIITLGVMNIVRSVAQYFTKGYKVEVPRGFQALANAEIGGQMLLPILYWLALAVLMYVLSKHTAFGRHIYAVGSNERTSRLSGINVDRVKLGVYMLMGLIVAVAAITQVARLRGVDVASAGTGYEMNAIAAVVVGGTSMAGGRGSIEGTVLGVLIIGIMNNLLVLLGIDAFLANAFTGAIIICAVLMQRKK